MKYNLNNTNNAMENGQSMQVNAYSDSSVSNANQVQIKPYLTTSTQCNTESMYTPSQNYDEASYPQIDDSSVFEGSCFGQNDNKKVDHTMNGDLSQYELEAEVDEIISNMDSANFGNISRSDGSRSDGNISCDPDSVTMYPSNTPIPAPQPQRVNAMKATMNMLKMNNNAPSLPNKVNKKKKRKKRGKNGDKEGIAYHPPKHLRAQGNIQISKTLTESIIPQRIAEPIREVYEYMDKMTAINCFENGMNLDCMEQQNLLIFNYGFHDKETNDLLYNIAEKQDVMNNKSRGYKWKMLNELFTKHQVMNLYNISPQHLPKLFDCHSISSLLSTRQTIKHSLCNQPFIQNMIKKAQWHKFNVFNRVNNKRRMTLSLTKLEFINRMFQFLQSTNMSQIDLIPILLFNNDDNLYLIEYVWIVRLEQGIDVGVAFALNKTTNAFKISGVHLDAEYIKAQHHLLYPNHTVPALESFQSNITDLAIGNPDDNLNKIKYYKQQIEELTAYKEYLKTVLNTDSNHRDVVLREIAQKSNLAEHKSLNNSQCQHRVQHQIQRPMPIQVQSHQSQAQHHGQRSPQNFGNRSPQNYGQRSPPSLNNTYNAYQQQLQQQRQRQQHQHQQQQAMMNRYQQSVQIAGYAPNQHFRSPQPTQQPTSTRTVYYNNPQSTLTNHNSSFMLHPPNVSNTSVCDQMFQRSVYQ